MSETEVWAMGRTSDDKNSVVGFMCLVDYECELGNADDGNKVFPSIESLREHRKCVGKCGIVEVEVSFRRVIEPGRIVGEF